MEILGEGDQFPMLFYFRAVGLFISLGLPRSNLSLFFLLSGRSPMIRPPPCLHLVGRMEERRGRHKFILSREFGKWDHEKKLLVPAPPRWPDEAQQLI
jgi:hypothetical protein